MHGIVAKYSRMVENGRITKSQAMDALQAYSRSLTLGRNFGETTESYQDCNPTAKQFYTDRKRVFGF